MVLLPPNSVSGTARLSFDRDGVRSVAGSLSGRDGDAALLAR